MGDLCDKFNECLTNKPNYLMKTLDIVFQKPFFPVYDVLSRFPGDEGEEEGSTNTGTEKPTPERPPGSGNNNEA